MSFKLLLLLSLALLHEHIAYVSQLKIYYLKQLRFARRIFQSSNSYAGPSFGTDSLERPDDEDSPEFKEYLKKLLEMQSLRARTGFSAPSSGSSDAYFAKLNRIKLERHARRELGLPEDDVDHDYRPEDYQSAGTDMEKNADGDMKNSKVFGPKAATNLARPLTAAEVRLAQAAEERANRLLEGIEIPKPKLIQSSMPKQTTEPKKVSVPSSPKPEVAVKPPSYLEQRAAATATKPKVWTPKSTSAVHTTNPNPSQITPTPSAVAPRQPPLSPRSPPSPASPLKVETPLPPRNLVLKRKLEVHELEVVGKALEMTVKHRGGGPFGAGRLPASEIPKLEEILNQAYEILVEDSKKAVAVEVESSTVKSTPNLPKLVNKPTQPKQTQPEPQSSSAAPAAVAAPPKIERTPSQPIQTQTPTNPKAQQQQNSVRSSQVASAATPVSVATPPQQHQPVPITVGIDRFLSAPEGMHVGELESIRDGLIQILAMVQDHIKRRPQSQPTSVDATQITPNQPLQPQQQTNSQIPEVDPTDRFISTYFKQDDAQTEKFDQEMQLALGLLLKHKGGPGFGHGRLKGKELQLLEQTLRSVASKLKDESER